MANQNVKLHHLRPRNQDAQFAGIADEEELLEAGGAEFEESWMDGLGEEAMAAIDNEPSVEEALEGPKSSLWRPAFQGEFDQIEKMDTWDLVELPPGMNLIKSCYVLRQKRDSDGNIAKYKV